MTDQELLAKLKQGDKKAFQVFYRQHHAKLLDYVGTRVRSMEDAQELVQDSFLGFLDSLPLFRGKSSLWTFLVSIAKHEIADYYRRLYAKRVLKCVPFVDLGYVEDLYSARETRHYFNLALAQIVPQDRQLLLWKYEHNLSLKEIAQKLDISDKAAESRLFRARKAFQLAYEAVTN